MQLFGLTIARTETLQKQLMPVDQTRGWWPIIREAATGNWQRNIEVRPETVLSFHAVFACQTLIASDISKMRVKLVRSDDGIWSETTNPAYSPVLRKPNHYQTRIQFFESWALSKLQAGNTYVLKQRDNRGVVTRLYVLDPMRVRPLVSETGEVFYELRRDDLSTQPEDTIVIPAREIIHDRFNTFFHPLVGLSPIYANGLAAMQGLAIQNNSQSFFENAARPSGVLIAPGDIKQADADRLSEAWQNKFTGDGRARVAVLGDGMKYQPMAMTSEESQLIDQLKWTAEVVCSTYHVPPYKIGVGALPSYNNVQALNVEYYSQCLQVLIEAIEICLDEGLATGEALGTEFDVENLLRMDSVTQMEVLDKGKNLMTPNEGRRKLDLKPVTGGDDVYRQQQDFSLEALAKRDAQEDPFGKAQAVAPSPPEPTADNADKDFASAIEKHWEAQIAA